MPTLVLKRWDCWSEGDTRCDYTPIDAVDAEQAAEAFIERQDHMSAEGVTDEAIVYVALRGSDEVERYRVRGEIVAAYHAELQS